MNGRGERAAEDPELAPRYAPEISLPEVAYLPGRTPRPLEADPAHERHPDPLGSPTFVRHFRYGIDLFNHGFFWECHEAWEALWLPLTPGDPIREQLQGLIQAAAALLKLQLDSPGPATSIWERGRARLAAVALEAPEGISLAVPLPMVIQAMDRAVASGRFPAIPPRIILR